MNDPSSSQQPLVHLPSSSFEASTSKKKRKVERPIEDIVADFVRDQRQLISAARLIADVHPALLKRDFVKG